MSNAAGAGSDPGSTATAVRSVQMSEFSETLVAAIAGVEERLAKQAEAQKQAAMLVEMLADRFVAVEKDVKGIASLQEDVVQLQAGNSALKTVMWQIDAKLEVVEKLSSQLSDVSSRWDRQTSGSNGHRDKIGREPSREPDAVSNGVAWPTEDYELESGPSWFDAHRQRLKELHASMDVFQTMKDKVAESQDGSFSKTQSKMEAFVESLKPPNDNETRDWIKYIGSSPPYRIFCTLVILAQVGIVGSEMDAKVKRAIQVGLCSEGLGGPASSMPDYSIYFQLEVAMVCWMFIELAINVYTTGRNGEGHGWNIFDAAILLASAVQLALSRLSLAFVRVLRMGRLLKFIRLVRLIKVMKIFRVLKLLHGVRKMILSMIGSITSLFWAILLMFFIIYVASVLCMQGIELHFEEEIAEGNSLSTFPNCTNPDAASWNYQSSDPWSGGYVEISAEDTVHMDLDILSPWQKVSKLYGSIDRTMTTFFAAISGGAEWATVSDPVVRLTIFFKVLWVAFICIMIFGVLNILTGIFVDAAMQAAQNDRHAIISKEKEDVEEASLVLREAFEKIDTDHSGTVSEEEFQTVFTDDEIKAMLNHLGLHTSDACGFFRLMDESRSGKVGIEEFVHSCMNLKGGARRIDAITLMSQNKRLAVAMMTLVDMMEDVYRDMERMKRRSIGSSRQQRPARRGSEDETDDMAI